VKRAILVLGAQRSGTSATSHVLSELGVQFGNRDRFIQFDHNPIFFELKWVNELNNRIVQALGHQYIDFFLPLEADFLASEIQPEIQAIEAELGRRIEQEWHGEGIEKTASQELIIGIKDPRISLTFPVWEWVLVAQGYSLQIVHVFRSPSGFLRSNQKLFHQWEGWTLDRHLHFWLQLNLAAIYFARRHPTYLLNYDQLIQFPLNEVSQLASALSLNVSLTERAITVIQLSHYHHNNCLESIPTNVSWVNEVYLKLCNRTISAEDYLNYRQQMRSISPV
jgi:hypothetical protein